MDLNKKFRAYYPLVKTFQTFTLSELEHHSAGKLNWNTIKIDESSQFFDEVGEELFENDIVEAIFNHHGKKSEIKFNAKIIFNKNVGSFQISYKNGKDKFVHDTIFSRYFLRKIGTVYQDEHLL